MTQIVFTGVTGMTLPYDVYGCDINGNNCILIASISNSIPLQITLTLPPIFDTYPGLTIKLSNCFDCEYVEYVICDNIIP